MDKKLIPLVVLVSLIGGCTSDRIRIARCDAPQPSVPCNSAPQSPVVTINRNAQVIAPSYICAEQGQTVRFQVVGAPTMATTAVVPENPFVIWLYGSNSANKDEFTVTVPEGTAPADYKYLVFDEGAWCVDPMVRVVR